MYSWEKSESEYAGDPKDLESTSSLVHLLRKRIEGGEDTLRTVIMAGRPAISGHGLWRDESGDLVPAIFVESPDSQQSESAFQDSSLAAYAVGADAPSNLKVVALPAVEPQSGGPTAVNSSLRFGVRTGRLGLPITTRRGVPGFTTAGHNAKATPIVVQDTAGSIVGEIRDAQFIRPSATGATEPLADIAVIEVDLSGQNARAVLMEKEWVVASVVPGAAVEFLVEGVRRRAFIRGSSSEYVLTRGEPPWGSVLICDAISSAGDSGGVVTDEGGRAVGHVVGGFPGSYTVIQDIRYALDYIGATIRKER